MNQGHPENTGRDFSRRWRCPACNEILRIHDDDPDPDLCPKCVSETELDKTRNRKKCQHCGEPHEVNDRVIEIDFKCKVCGKKTVWRQPGLVIHHLEDEETFQRLKPVLIVLGIIFGSVMIYGIAKDFDIREITPFQVLILIFVVIGIIRFIFFNKRKCESCEESSPMKRVATARMPQGVMRHIYQCSSCGFKIAEDTYGSGERSRTERVYAGSAPDFRCEDTFEFEQDAPEESKHDVPQAEKMTTKTTVQAVVILLVLGVLVLTFGQTCYGVWVATTTLEWPSTAGTMTEMSIQERVEGSPVGDTTYYQPVVGYTYEVNNAKYQSTRVAWNLLESSSRHRIEQILGQFRGNDVNVYYDPGDPSRAVLLRGISRDDSSYMKATTVVCLIIWFAAYVLIEGAKSSNCGPLKILNHVPHKVCNVIAFLVFLASIFLFAYFHPGSPDEPPLTSSVRNVALMIEFTVC